MKPRRLLWTSSALCLLIASCDKPKPAASGESNAADSLAAERAALEDERMEVERQRLEDERAALEEEKAALEAEREARLAAREDQADQRDLTLEERQQVLADREADLSEREGDLADRESSLSDRELELAGQEELDDWEPEPVADFQEPVADYDTFYNDLQPYGSWFETPDYGYVYQPTVVVQDTSWRPYTRGRWACTNRGWTWVSDEPFGWACFHYGRWAHVSGRGWVWVPGDEWAPSWVCWREGGDHVGWAPLPPETLCYRGRGWSRSVEADFGIGHIHFTFIHCRHMADPIWRHCLPIARNNDCIRGSANITNIRFDRNRIICGGPRYEKLRALVGKPWPVYRLETDRYRAIRDLNERNAHFRGNRLAVFAPNLNARWNADLRPQRVAGKWDDVKIARSENGIKPEWTERFREARQKQREQAVTWKRDRAGSQGAEVELQANREKVAQAQNAYLAKQRELVEARRAKQLEKREAFTGSPLPGAVTGRPASPGQASEGEKPAPKPSLAERQREMAERMRESRTRAQVERQQDAPREMSAEPAVRPDNRPAPSAADNGRRERQQQSQVLPGREGNNGQVAQEETRRQRLEEMRLQQQEQIRERQEQTRQRQENARQREEQARQAQEQSRGEAEESDRRERMDQARREQAEQARQQQQERQRQQEEGRQRQQEVARQRQDQARRQVEDDQRRQQQEEMQRQQQERAREQQEERARQQERMREQQERARQQEEERARRQEEMQRRQEEARREAEERARQQQVERARQQEERQRQQEEARRQQEERQREQQERARQEQEERARQQEERQRQQEERQREQQERARQEQEERSRRQQDEGQRQRGR